MATSEGKDGDEKDVVKTSFSSSYTPKRVVLYVIWRSMEAESWCPLELWQGC